MVSRITEHIPTRRYGVPNAQKTEESLIGVIKIVSAISNINVVHSIDTSRSFALRHENELPAFDVEVLLPVHNEGASIERTVRGMHAEISKVANASFIVCEDGSRDNSKQVLRDLSGTIANSPQSE